MPLRSYFFGLFSATLLAFGVWLAIFFYSDPELADFLTYAAFFSSLFLWVTGALTFIIFYLRVSLSNREVVFAHLPVAIRHAALGSVAVVAILVFQTLRVLSAWEVILVGFILVLIELAAQAKLTKQHK